MIVPWTPTSDLLVAQVAADYLDALDERPVDATISSAEVWSRLPDGLPAEGLGADAVRPSCWSASTAHVTVGRATWSRKWPCSCPGKLGDDRGEGLDVRGLDHVVAVAPALAARVEALGDLRP